MTDLTDLLTEVAGRAPETGMADRALRAAHRRRVRALTAAPLAVLLAAAAVLGAPTVLHRLVPPGPSGPAERLGLLNAHVPGALPARGVAPVRLAYVDYCRTTAARAAGRACAEWRVLTRDGVQYRVPHSLGAYRAGSNADGDVATPSRLFAVSADGRRVMYYRADRHRVVVRDLGTGHEWSVLRLPPSTLRAEPVEFVLNRDGTWAGVEAGAVTRSAADPHPPRPWLIGVAHGTVTRLPAGRVFAAIAPGGTAYLANEGADATTVVEYDTHGRVAGRVDGAHFGYVSPDGTQTAGLGVPWSRMLSVRDLRTGGLHATLRPRGLPSGQLGVVAWPRPSAVTLAGRLTTSHGLDDGVPGRFGFYTLAVPSGRIVGRGTFTLTGKRTQVVYGAITPPGSG